MRGVQSQLPPNRLRELRESRALKRYDIAALVRFDPATVYRWEVGLSPVPDEVKLELAKHYGVTIEHLMGWDGAEAAA